MSRIELATASELMNREILTLAEDAPLKEAIAALEDYRISGAPVVNVEGRCVGVFSVSDLLRRGVEVDEGETPTSGAYFAGDPFSDDPGEWFEKGSYDDVLLGPDTVGQWMSTDVQSVSSEELLPEICKTMARERIHRVLVMDGEKLLGIISSFDVVRFVAGERALC